MQLRRGSVAHWPTSQAILGRRQKTNPISVLKTLNLLILRKKRPPQSPTHPNVKAKTSAHRALSLEQNSLLSRPLGARVNNSGFRPYIVVNEKVREVREVPRQPYILSPKDLPAVFATVLPFIPQRFGWIKSRESAPPGTASTYYCGRRVLNSACEDF
jgi:hypothetical protein